MKRLFDPIGPMPLWPGEPPLRSADDAAMHHAECVQDDSDFCQRVANVSVPTLQVFPATGLGARPCVLVIPGGGYGILAWNHEGTDVVHWLLANGISAALLKYRVPGRRDQALADARRAMRLLRANAAGWNVDPARVGAIGFSAGAHVALRACCSTEPDVPPADDADAFSSRPDFCLPIYPAYVDRPGFGHDPDLDFAAFPGPAFLAVSRDDPYFESGLCCSIAMWKANVPFELHVFPDGGHGWGMSRNGRAHAAWPELAAAWLRRILPAAP